MVCPSTLPVIGEWVESGHVVVIDTKTTGGTRDIEGHRPGGESPVPDRSEDNMSISCLMTAGTVPFSTMATGVTSGS